MGCRMCSENPFTMFFGLSTQTPPPTVARKARSTTEEFKPRSDEEVMAAVQQWERCIHPRTRDMFSSRELLQQFLMHVAKATGKNGDPIFDPGWKCIQWTSKVTLEDLREASKSVEPGEHEDSVAYARRVLAYIFATDESFELLQKMTETVTMSCNDSNCVRFDHIVVAERR